MSTDLEIPSELDELSKSWPAQVINNYEQWFKAWRVSARMNLEPGSEAHYEHIGREWATFANGRSLNPRLMLEWHNMAISKHNKYGEAISRRRVRNYHFVLKLFLKWLKNCTIIKMDPGCFLPQIRAEPEGEVRFWTHGEYTAMVRWAEGKPRYQVALWLWILGYHTGMSLCDCCDLKWDEVHIQPDGPCIIERIRQKLKRRGRRAICRIPVLVGGELWRWLKLLEKDRPKGAVYVHRETPHVYGEGKGSFIRKLFKEMAIGGLGYDPGKTFHNLRNSFASRLINSGTDGILVSKMTGHQSMRQLADYVTPNIRAMQDAVFEAWRWAEENELQEPPPPILALPSPSATPTNGDASIPNSSLALESGGAANVTTNNRS